MVFESPDSGLDAASWPRTSRVRVGVVVPVFNSLMSLPELHARIEECVASPHYELEIVYVDDGSTDGSGQALHQIQKNASNVVVLEHSYNRGQGNALLTGVLATRGEIVVTLDDDLQQHPSDILRLLATLEGARPATLVMGIADEMKRPAWRGWLSICANMISNLFLDKPLPLRPTTFCAFRRQLATHLDPALDHELPLVTALVQAASETRPVPVHLNPSMRDRSRYTLKPLIRLFLSRSRYYRMSRILVMLLGASLAVLASYGMLFVEGGTNSPILILTSGVLSAIWLLLARLAIGVQRQTARMDVLRANRSA